MNNASLYAKSHNVQWSDVTNLMEEFSETLGKMSGRCLDIGCGPGDVTCNLLLPRLPLDATVTGVDISKEMVDYARKSCNGERRASFKVLDIETKALPVEDIEYYDSIVSFYCLHWCHELIMTYQNIFDMVRPGAEGLCLFIASNTTFDAYVAMKEHPTFGQHLWDVEKFVPYFHYRSDAEAELTRILEDIGFDVISCSREERSYTVENIDELTAVWLAVNPFISRVPESLREEFKETLMNEIVSRKFVTDESETILDRYYNLIVHFKKPEKLNCQIL